MPVVPAECLQVPADDTRVSVLATVPLDVYTHILSFLPRSALAALMRTSRSLLTDTTPILCARAGRCSFSKMNHLCLFNVFLRVSAETPRVELVRNLRLSIWKLLTAPRSNFAEEDKQRIRYAASMLSMMLHTILPRCPNLLRLYLDDSRPKDEELPIYREPSNEENEGVLASLYDLVGSLVQLEELTIPITHKMGVTDWADEDVDFSEEEERAPGDIESHDGDDGDDLGLQDGYQGTNESPSEEATQVRITSLTNLRALRKLTMESACGPYRLPWVLVDLQPLASSSNLTELCIIAYSPLMPAEPFVHVRTLKTCMPLPPNTAADFAIAFPNLTDLTFIRPGPTPNVEKLREVNARRWNVLPQSKRWTSLQTVCAKDNLVFYSLALPEHVPSVYIGEYPASHLPRRLLTGRNTPKFPLLLAQTRPTLLQLRIEVRCSDRWDNPWLREIARHRTDSVHCLILDIASYQGVNCKWTEGLKDALLPVLATLTKLTHLLITIDVRGYPSWDRVLAMSTGDILMTRAAASAAQSSRSLRWVGVHVKGWPLRGWTISYRPSAEGPDGKAASSAFEYVFVEMSGEEAALKVLSAEGMTVFAGEKTSEL
ncbi:hypothetical protein K466DRAFT_585635 [Polyporus arcularius HHB13444]|uniref:F-box domain-containing protein n=1 Tax=Polyporus arcularius HHB13444 TaxID=1314778 RepID=A0A5C3PJA7_9APHY|nr:hypothetical protein K466DRAFT_585635 [Polyporus arcularius HHB13444]